MATSKKIQSRKLGALWNKRLFTVGLAATMAAGLALAVSTFASGGQDGFCQGVTKNHKVSYDAGTYYVNGKKLSRSTAKRFARNCMMDGTHLWNKDYAVGSDGSVYANKEAANEASKAVGIKPPTDNDYRIAKKYVGTTDRFAVCGAIRRAEGGRGHDHSKGIAKILKEKMSASGFRYYDTGCA